MSYGKELEREVASWPSVTVHSHRFGGREFLFGKAQVGHVHWGRTIDIPFSRAIRDALITDGLAREHRWVPNSGWVTFHLRTTPDLHHALWLIRLSYLRYASRAAGDPYSFLEREAHAMKLNSTYECLLRKSIPASLVNVE